jgi:hypothetical protein
MGGWFRSSSRLLVVAAAVLWIAGCYEDPEVTRYEPGQYKGAPDPLRQKQKTAQQTQRLEERLRTVQMDR